MSYKTWKDEPFCFAPTKKLGGGWIAHKSSPSAPPAPDYTGAAKATAAGNLANLNAQTEANRPNQITPWGTSTWTSTPTFNQSGYDTATADWNKSNSQGTWVPESSTTSGGDQFGGGTNVTTPGHWTGATSNGSAAPNKADYTTNQWTQNLQLTPAEQSALNDQQSIQSNQSHLAQTMQGQVASTMAGGFNAPKLGDYTSGVGTVNQDFSGFNPTGVNAVNQNAPQFDNRTAMQGAMASYNSQMGLLQPQMSQDSTNLDAKLRLQGLTPGTEAYNNASQNLGRTQAATQTQVANQAVLSGNQMANQNYASSLSGYNAGNAAQNQAYGQSLAGYGADQSAQQAGNAAVGQANSQALQNYGTAYTSALQNYLQPLNSMNAAMNGQQVQSPTMPSFASSGYTPGADMTSANNALGSWNQGVYNSQAAGVANSNSSTMGTIGAIAAAFI